MNFVSVNPATGKVIQRYRQAPKAAIERALAQAAAAQRDWRQASVKDRVALWRKVDQVLVGRLEELAQLATAEMGKPIAQSRAELAKCRTLFSYYREQGPLLLADDHPPASAKNCHVRYEPLGTILAIMPWNFPFWQVLRGAVPALTAGNAMLLKHAPNVSGCALAIEELFTAAGAPRGLFQTLLLANHDVPAVLQDPRVHGVTMTGSTRAGQIVGGIAGQAMKKAVFELGGSDPYLVLKDADLDQAAEICANSRLLNSGQSCVCAKRFIVDAKVRKAFEQRFVTRLAARTVGDPTLESTQVGPIARADLRDHLDEQVRASMAKGASALLGGHPISGPGYFYAPTLLTNVRPGSPAYDEELFGPVASVIVAKSEDDAVRIANSSEYGLGSAIFSRSHRRALALSRRLDAGQVFINDFVRSDPSLPFGGVKLSGHGRELGPQGLREFTNVKTICIGT